MAYRPAKVYTGSGWDDIGDSRLLTHNHDGSTGGVKLPQSSITNLTTDLASKANYPSGGTDGQALVKSGTTTAWSTISPHANSSQAEVTTNQTTTSTSFTDLATAGPAVTVTTGTKALVIISCVAVSSSGGGVSTMSFAVSGATSVSAADKWGIANTVLGGQGYNGSSRAYLLTGLTAGSNTFTAKYKTGNSAQEAQFYDRQIIVIDMGS